MTPGATPEMQPVQQSHLWDVSLIADEPVFAPPTNVFATRAPILLPGARCLDVSAGAALPVDRVKLCPGRVRSGETGARRGP